MPPSADTLAPFHVVKDPALIPARESAMLALWEAGRIFERSMAQTAGGPEWIFYEGPPTANGAPHAGHVITRAVKDLFPRWRTMQGYHVARKGGWDTHGLPVEIEVEKVLGLFSPQEIEEYGIGEFVQRCRESVWKYVDAWRELTVRMAYWIDLDHPYVTYERDYIESLWWILKQVHNAGLLYQGHKVVPYCFRCGSPLSSHEVAQGYQDVQDPSLTVAFFKAGTEHKEALLAWTTTPWTLPSNMLLAVGPKIAYVTVRLPDGDLVTLAEARAAAVLGERFTPEAVVARMLGRELVDAPYEPLYPIAEADHSDPRRRAHRVVAADFVSTEDGTGIVHIAPGYGEDDHRVGLEQGLPLVQRVATTGKFTDDAPEFLRGLHFKDGDKEVIRDLKARGQVFAQQTHQHNYPFCYRHNVPLMYRAEPAWFIRTTAIKDSLIEANSTIRWVPETIGTGRFGNFLEHNVDWALSRNRYWGTPLPIWRGMTADGEVVTRVVQSVAELEQLTGEDLAELDLHRPAIDAVTFTDPETGAVMRRIEEVGDCWFDSGAMPVAQAGWPRTKGEDGGLITGYPAAWICEAVDQTRGWFYTLHAIACLLHHIANLPQNADNPELAPFRQSPVSYQSCLVLGHVLDKQGLKMSKSKKNVVDSMAVIDEFGADAMRWYFFANTDPWTPQRYYMEGVREANRQFLLTLRNVASFFGTYAAIDRFDPTLPPKASTDELDRWIRSRLQGTIRTVTERLEAIDILPAAQALAAFVDHLSTWWLRRSRARFWSSDGSAGKWEAYWTLHECLTTFSRLIAPFTPFIAEELHQALVRPFGSDAPESVHLLTWPTPDPALEDLALESAMAVVLQVTELGRRARTNAQIKTRQPLPRLEVIGASAEARAAIEAHAQLLADELNVKLVEIARDPAEYVSFSAKPNYPVVGPRFGKQMKEVAAAVAGLAPEAVLAVALEGRSAAITLGGETVTLSAEELEARIEPKPGFAAAMEAGVGVVLDTAITEALRREGLAREVVHQISEYRKQADFPYEARIAVMVQSDAQVLAAVREHENYVTGETLTVQLALEAIGEGSENGAPSLEVDGHPLRLIVTQMAQGQ